MEHWQNMRKCDVGRALIVELAICGVYSALSGVKVTSKFCHPSVFPTKYLRLRSQSSEIPHWHFYSLWLWKANGGSRVRRATTPNLGFIGIFSRFRFILFPVWQVLSSSIWIPWNLSFRYILFHKKKDSKRCCDTATPESIHTKEESKRGSAFAFIFGVNWPVQWM